MSEVKFEIKKHYGIISKVSNEKRVNHGWAKELNIVEWNGGVPKYDIREWSPDHTRMTRGITLTEPEIRALKEILNKAITD